MNLFKSLFAPDVSKLAAQNNLEGLVRALGHDSSKIQEQAVTALLEKVRAMQARNDLKGLLDLLEMLLSNPSDVTWKVSTQASDALCRLGYAPEIQKRIDSLGDEKGCKDEAESLLRIGSPAVELLITAAQKEDRIAYVAKQLLDAIDDPRAEQYKIPLSHNTEDLVSELVRLGRKPVPDSWQDHYFTSYGYVRTRRIGEHLDRLGGYKLMAKVAQDVRARMGTSGRGLEWAWHRIGEWLA